MYEISRVAELSITASLHSGITFLLQIYCIKMNLFVVWDGLWSDDRSLNQADYIFNLG